MSSIITGCDLGRGGGTNIDLLPHVPIEIVLARPVSAWLPTEPTQDTQVDIWGLDPRLVIACSFYRSEDPNALSGFQNLDPGRMVGVISASVLTRTAMGEHEGPTIDPSILFVNGGNLDATGGEDFCELCSSVQGVRFRLSLGRSDSTSVDVMLAIQARAQVALVCPELALELFRGLIVSIPDALRF